MIFGQRFLSFISRELKDGGDNGNQLQFARGIATDDQPDIIKEEEFASTDSGLQEATEYTVNITVDEYTVDIQ